MTPSHSSHFLNLDSLTTLSSPLSQSSVSRQVPAGGPKSSPGKGLCVSAGDSRVHGLFLESTDPLEPSGVVGIQLERAKLMSGLNNLTIPVTTQKEERDKVLVILLARGEMVKSCFQLQSLHRSENNSTAPSFYCLLGVPSLQKH
ncbi:hypothetical protein AMECASPLE_031955 [Ameca splendens]|uniref:Uncharacterized protein n=1 Tax=Ameca splendens TaxID=208324 RepID=A0ABV0ZRC2_9TELE